MTDFNLRKFLTENQLTRTSQNVQEVLGLLGLLGPPPFDMDQALTLVRHYLQKASEDEWEDSDGDMSSPIPPDPRDWRDDLIYTMVESYYLDGPFKEYHASIDTPEEEQKDIARYESYQEGLTDLARTSKEFAYSVGDMIDNMMSDMAYDRRQDASFNDPHDYYPTNHSQYRDF